MVKILFSLKQWHKNNLIISSTCTDKFEHLIRIESELHFISSLSSLTYHLKKVIVVSQR